MRSRILVFVGMLAASQASYAGEFESNLCLSETPYLVGSVMPYETSIGAMGTGSIRITRQVDVVPSMQIEDADDDLFGEGFVARVFLDEKLALGAGLMYMSGPYNADRALFSMGRQSSHAVGTYVYGIQGSYTFNMFKVKFTLTIAALLPTSRNSSGITSEFRYIF